MRYGKRNQILLLSALVAAILLTAVVYWITNRPDAVDTAPAPPPLPAPALPNP